MTGTAKKLRELLDGIDVTPDVVARALGVHMSTVYRHFQHDNFTPDELAMIHAEFLRERSPIEYTDLATSMFISVRVYGYDRWGLLPTNIG